MAVIFKFRIFSHPILKLERLSKFFTALWIHHEWNLKSIEVEMTLDIEGKTWGSKMLLFYYLKNTFAENIISVYELLKLVTANIFSVAF